MLLVGNERQTMGSFSVSNPNLHHQDNNNLHEEPGTHRKRKLTAYERATGELQSDERVKQEISLGRRVGLYQIRGNIGSGNFSQVKLAVHVLTGEQVAMKILDKTRLDAKTQRLLSREISSMERLHHPNVIRLYEVVETLHKLHLIMEYAAGGELYTKLHTQGKFPEPKAKFIFAQIVSALDHLHSCGVIHRDLKAENVFFAAPSDNTHATQLGMSSEVLGGDPQSVALSARQLHIKLGDFGFSTQAAPQDQLTTFCGSPPYAAPELYKDDWYHGPPVDIWAAGVLLYFMLTAMMPFRADTVARLKRLILAGNYLLPGWLSPEAKMLVKQLLHSLPGQRITIPGIRAHVWLKGETFPEPLKPYPKTLDAFLLSSKKRPDENHAEGSENALHNNNNLNSPSTVPTNRSHLLLPASELTPAILEVDGASGGSSEVCTPLSTPLSRQTSTSTGTTTETSTPYRPSTDRLASVNSPSDDPHREVKQLLSELGITEEHLLKDANQDARSNITGTYRIVLHRVHKSRRMSNIPWRLAHANSDSQINTAGQFRPGGSHEIAGPGRGGTTAAQNRGKHSKTMSETMTSGDTSSLDGVQRKTPGSKLCHLL